MVRKEIERITVLTLTNYLGCYWAPQSGIPQIQELVLNLAGPEIQFVKAQAVIWAIINFLALFHLLIRQPPSLLILLYAAGGWQDRPH